MSLMAMQSKDGEPPIGFSNVELMNSGIVRSEEAWRRSPKNRQMLEKANTDNSYKHGQS